jgi:DsbC/DsbD-like thiol-disulfide interchange protein
MTRKNLSLLLTLICSLLLLAACSRTETKPADAPAASSKESPAGLSDPSSITSSESAAAPADVVQASAPEVELKAGGSAEAAVRVKIAEGYHINGNPASKFQIATALEVEAGEGINAGKPVYPPAVTKEFEFAKEPLQVYEKEAVIRLPLRADATAAKTSRLLRGKLKVQPCNDKVCFPPRTLDVSLPVNVK